MLLNVSLYTCLQDVIWWRAQSYILADTQEPDLTVIPGPSEDNCVEKVIVFYDLETTGLSMKIYINWKIGNVQALGTNEYARLAKIFHLFSKVYTKTWYFLTILIIYFILKK